MDRTARRARTAYLLLGMLFLSSVFATQGALLTSMIEAFGLRASRQGAAYAAAAFGGIAALASAFLLNGRVGKYTLLKASFLLCAASLAVLWLAPGYGLFTAGWFALGYGVGLMDTLLSACMADLYSGRQATFMMCMLHTAYGIASMLTPIGFGAALSGGADWKTIYLGMGICGVILAAAGILAGRRVARGGGDAPRERPSLASIPADIRRSRLVMPIGAMFFHGLFLAGLNTWINRYAETLPGGGDIPAMSFLFMGVMVSRLAAPLLPFSTARYVKAAPFLACAAFTAGLLLPGGLALKICVAACGALFGAMIPCILSLSCQGSGGGNTLLVTTALMLALYLGQSAASPLIGAMEAWKGLKAGISLCAVGMVICGGFCLMWKAEGGKGSDR